MLGCLFWFRWVPSNVGRGIRGSKGFATALSRQAGREDGGLAQVLGKRVFWLGKGLAVSALLMALAGGALPAFAQVNTRLLLSTGTEVPGHGGLAS